MYFTYILESRRTGRYYIGVTGNIATRVRRHNGGLVKSTKAFMPWKLVHLEKYPSLKEARAREAQVKSWKKRVAIERLAKFK